MFVDTEIPTSAAAYAAISKNGSIKKNGVVT